MKTSRSEVTWLYVHDLDYHHYAAQRLKLPTAARLRDFVPWNEDAVGVGKVSHRKMPDGTVQWRVLDGRTRAFAAQKYCGNDYQMRFEVFYDLTDEEESRIFLDSNDTKSTGPHDKYINGVIAYTGPYPEIQKILEEFGLEAATSASTHRIGAVASLVRIVDQHGSSILHDALSVIITSYGYDKTNWDNGFMQAVAHLIDNNSNIDLDRLINVLKKQGVDYWIRKGRTAKTHGGGSLSRSYPVAAEIAESYNSRLRTEDKKITVHKQRRSS